MEAMRATEVVAADEAEKAEAWEERPYVHAYEQSGVEAGGGWAAVAAVRLAACPVERVDAYQAAAAAARRVRGQVDFVGSLFRPGATPTFALRYVTRPDPADPAAAGVDVVLLAKVQAMNPADAQARAVELVAEVLPLLRGALPEHEWEVVADPAAFDAVWAPFDWDTAHVAEIRRREDRIPRGGAPLPPYRLPAGRAPAEEDERKVEDEDAGAEAATRDAAYVVYPFAPRASTLPRLLRILLLHRSPVVWQVALKPTRLSEPERAALAAQVAACDAGPFADGGAYGAAPDAVGHRRAAAASGVLMEHLARLADAPFLLNVTVASPAPLPRTLLEAVGAEVTAPVGESADPYVLPAMDRGGHDLALPRGADERAAARGNARRLAFASWGPTAAPAGLRRLRHLVGAPEAAGAFRVPIAGDEGMPGMTVRRARTRPAPRELALLARAAPAGTLTPMGTSLRNGRGRPVCLAETDRRQHVYVVGQTGTGKTTLLRTMVQADMAAGRGVAVIDPHGDLFADLLASVPPHRVEDVVALDPTDVEFPVGLNLLECRNGDEGAVPEQERHFVVREMRAIMERLIEDQYPGHIGEFAGPVFFQHMQMNMLLAMSNPEDPGTLLEFHEILQSKDYWKRWLPLKWSDARLKRWVEMTLPGMDYTRRSSENSAMGEWVSAKFEDFILDPRLRLMFGQKRSTIDLRRVMDEGKILLVNLAKGQLTEANARFLGMVLMAKVQAAAMSRVNTPPEKRRPFYLYVDEFQSLATDNFVLLLSEGRKFGLGVVLANQFVSQLSGGHRHGRITDAIFGNVGTIAALRTGRTDAHALEPYFAPAFGADDLANLPNWQACVRTTAAGQVVPPFTLHVSPPGGADGGRDEGTARRVRERSRARYGRPRAEVEREIARSLEGPAKDE